MRGHEFLEVGTRVGGEPVAGMPQVMEVNAVRSNRLTPSGVRFGQGRVTN
jgi:hypothetical protein